MKNISKPLLFPIGVCLLMSCIFCNQKENLDHEGYTLLDSGRAGFIKPAKSAEISGVLNELQALNPHVVCVLKADTTETNSSLISICKYVGDSIIPMEIVFIDDVLKQQGTLLDCKSNLVDFGIYDKGNKRFRYKIVNIDKDCFKNVLNQADSSDNQDTTSSYLSSDIYRVLYYLMKNDNDSVMYELSITSRQSGIAESDSLLEEIVASFRYFD